jgi:flagellar hook-associated protein 1
MSLTSALRIAQSALQTTTQQTTIVTRNVSDASNPDYSRRAAVVVSTDPGSRSVQIQRATNDLLFRQNLQALASWSGQDALNSSLDQLELSVNGPDGSSSASTAIGNLQQALQLYASTPADQNVGASVIDAAKQVVRSLNDGTKAIQDFRTQTDAQIDTAVGQLNDLLNQFQAANTAIVKGTTSGADVSDAMDQRDSILKQIAEYVPISTYSRTNNDMVITTGDGTMLFETVPRSVTFQPSTGYAAGTTGNSVYIDGVPMSTGSGGDTTAGGKISGLIQARDGVASTMQSQLDEVARGLITAFSEDSPTQPDAAGLFTQGGSTAVPAAGTLVPGLAGQISINKLMDPDQGGDVTLLRDGGANGAGYVDNPTGGASYADRLIAYGDKLDAPMAFSPAAGITAQSSVVSYSAGSIGWFEAIRQQSSTASDNKEALATRTAEALSDDTGVNVDTEMSKLLDLEHTYQASARILNTVNEMLSSLFNTVDAVSA